MSQPTTDATPERIVSKSPIEPVIKTLRGLIVDMVCQANSGHTGGPLSSLPFAAVLFTRFMNYNPDDAAWCNRDRFVLSCGHESALLYGLLAMQGFLSIDDLKLFRQMHSKTPGHPERGITPGVETTTGPLGQGFANAVGMAVAEDVKRRALGEDIVRHFTYVLASDGDMQEGIVTEAAELAAKWQLGRLVVYYDYNAKQIDGASKDVTAVDYAHKFEALGWHVLAINGHDLNEIEWAIHKARDEAARPTIIIGRTNIGYGLASMEDNHDTHGVPLSAKEADASKEAWGIPGAHKFWVDAEAKGIFADLNELLRERIKIWQQNFDRRQQDESFVKLWQVYAATPYQNTQVLPWDTLKVTHPVDTRSTNGQVVAFLGEQLKTFFAGSADLGGSVKTRSLEKVAGGYTGAGSNGRYISYGVREHAMGAIANGIAAYGGFIPATSTFLVFADYMKPAIRLAALMGLPVKFVFSHDTIYVGEDGPTHQPVDQLAMLRAIPGLRVYRPADGLESVEAWKSALEYTQGPSVLVFTRQKLAEVNRVTGQPATQVSKGAYLVFGKHFQKAEAVIFSSGSEVGICVQAAEQLVERDGICVRVVSVPSWEIFRQQSDAYKTEVLMPTITKRIAVEAASALGWEAFVGMNGLMITMDSFGLCGPAEKVADHFGFTPDKVRERVKAFIKA